MMPAHNVIHSCKPANHCGVNLVISLHTSLSTTGGVFTVSSRFQGMPKWPTSCPRGRVRQSAHPGRSRRRCWFHRTGRAEQSWLTRCCQRTGRNSWCKISHWSPLQTKRGGKRRCWKRGAVFLHNLTDNHFFCFSYISTDITCLCPSVSGLNHLATTPKN